MNDRTSKCSCCKVSFFAVLLFVLVISCEKDKVETGTTALETELVYSDKNCEACDFVVSADDWKFDGEEHGVQPGDTIGLPEGNRDGLFIVNVHGTEDLPVVIINCDGKAVLGTSKDVSKGIDIQESSHFKLSGTGDTDNLYGIAVIGYMALEIAYLSTDFEVCGIEVLAAGYAGIVARSDASCDGLVSKENFTQYNTIIHDNYVHDTEGEGFYIGGSHWGTGQSYQPGCEGTLLYEPELKGVRVYNNIVKNIGMDAIQVGSAVEDCEIYNNYIENFGLNSVESHMTGFQINPGTTGKLYNNIINGGNGFGIFMTGRGGNTVYNNLIIDASYDGIMDGDRTPTEGMGFSYINNTIINPGQNGYVSWSSETSSNVFYNNIITNPGNSYTDGISANKDFANNVYTSNLDSLLFENASILNYSPTQGSPLIDAGKDVSAYGIDYDITNNTRPNGDAYDIGAFEY